MKFTLDGREHDTAQCSKVQITPWMVFFNSNGGTWAAMRNDLGEDVVEELKSVDK